MKTVIILQARMSSTRLPGKVLKEVMSRPLLLYQLERLKRVKEADSLVVATTTNAGDDRIMSLCEQMSVSCFRGSEDDVLARYHGAAVEYEADVIVRVTGDCPLIDPSVVDKVIRSFKDSQPTVAYASNCLERTYPRGMDCEVFSFKVLDEVSHEATDVGDREHVTPFMYRHPERYQQLNVAYHENQSLHRWTVDTAEDFELVRKLLEALYPLTPNFTMEDCLRIMTEHSDWAAINKDVIQKAAGR